MLTRDQRAGIYITAIVHLAVIVIMLSSQISASSKPETSFVLDFTKQEELEKMEKEAAEMAAKLERIERVRAQMHKDLDKQLSSTPAPKNITVNKGSGLSDDRGTDSKKLYEDAKKLENELKKGYVPKDKPLEAEGDLAADDKSKPETGNNAPKSGAQYSGASVLCWQLDGRQAKSLPVPTYKCMGAGQVTVIIEVNHSGQVVKAMIQDGVSSSDGCLRKQSIAYAKRARFNSTNDASIPDPQTGNIVYEFVAQ